MIYFDHNATTPLDDQVLEAMLPYLATFFANPSSLYRAGRINRSAIDTAREQVAELVNAQAAQIIFTSGGTEANNLALKGLIPDSGSFKIAVSAIEHPSVLETARSLVNQNLAIDMIDVDVDGQIKLKDINAAISSGIDFISLMLANNETGAVQDIAEISANIGSQIPVIHTDAVQALGKIPVDFNQLGVQLMTLSSHKIYGPKGCGALVVDKRVSLNPLISGGEQEHGGRAGTENVAAIVGFGKAAELARVQLQQRHKHLLKLLRQLEAGLESIPGLVIFSKAVQRLPNTVQFGIPGIDGEMLLMQLDQKGIAVSSGSACSSGAGQASHVLLAMDVDEALAKSAIRMSLGQANTEQEVLQVVETLKSLVLVP